MRTLLVRLSVVLTTALGFAPNAHCADPYPSRAIKLIAPYTPGGPADVRARWLAQQLSPVLGQPVVVDNRAGAGGVIGTQVAAQSAPDGYTLVMAQEGTLAFAPHLYAHLAYDPLN